MRHANQRRENARVEVVNAGGKGMGLKLLESVEKGQFIAEYVGEVRFVTDANYYAQARMLTCKTKVTQDWLTALHTSFAAC